MRYLFALLMLLPLAAYAANPTVNIYCKLPSFNSPDYIGVEFLPTDKGSNYYQIYDSKTNKTILLPVNSCILEIEGRIGA